jgi:hypothetical protein
MKKVLILFSFFLLANVGCTLSDPEMMELLQEIKAQNDKLLQEVEAMKSQLSLLDGKYQVILANLVDNKKELEALKNQIDALKAQIAQQLIKIDQLSAQLTQQGADIIKLSQEIKELKASCEELKGKIEELLADKSSVPTNGLVGWWPFNGNANDESGNGNNGIVNGASLTTDRFNSASKSYDFNGTSNYISLKSTFFNNPTKVSSFSYSFWIRPNSLPATGKDFIISGKEGFWRTIVVSLKDNGEFIIGGSQPTPQGYFGVSSKQKVVLNEWQHVAITFLQGQFSLYLNGTLVNSATINYTSLEFEFLQQGNSTATNFFGAAHPVSPGITYHFKGKLDDYGVWNRVLTADEISRIYKGEKF